MVFISLSKINTIMKSTRVGFINKLLPDEVSCTFFCSVSWTGLSWAGFSAALSLSLNCCPSWTSSAILSFVSVTSCFKQPFLKSNQRSTVMELNGVNDICTLLNSADRAFLRHWNLLNSLTRQTKFVLFSIFHRSFSVFFAAKLSLKGKFLQFNCSASKEIVWFAWVHGHL